MVETLTRTLTTGKGRKVVTSLTDEEAFEKLSDLTKNKFAKDLRSKPLGLLSGDQIAWVHILAIEGPKKKRDAVKLAAGDLSNIKELLLGAGEKLKYPKIRIIAGNYRITLKVRNGVVYIEDADRTIYNSYRGEDTPIYYGRIEGGDFHPSEHSGEEILYTLNRFANDPIAEAQKYGRLTGRCSFCGRELTDKVSLEKGFGPVCANKYGL